MAIKCPACPHELSVDLFLEACGCSIPREDQIFFGCPECKTISAIKMTEGELQIGESRHRLPNLKVYKDETYGLDCVVNGKLYHFPLE